MLAKEKSQIFFGELCAITKFNFTAEDVGKEKLDEVEKKCKKEKGNLQVNFGKYIKDGKIPHGKLLHQKDTGSFKEKTLSDFFEHSCPDGVRATNTSIEWLGKVKSGSDKADKLMVNIIEVLKGVKGTSVHYGRKVAAACSQATV